MLPYRSWVLYGRSGTGNTTLAGTFPTPALLIDANDKGTDSVADVEGLEVYDAKTWDDIDQVYWWLHAHPSKFRTVILDTMSQMQQLCIKHVMREDGKSEANVGKWSGKEGVSRRQWGVISSMMKVVITQFRDLPIECVFIAQDRIFNLAGDEDDETPTDNMIDPEVGPQLSPSVAKHLNASVHVIGNTFLRRRMVTKKVKEGKREREVQHEKIEYCLRIGPNPVYVTKMRKPKDIIPPAVIVDPTYDDLINIINGKK
jgi:hypothetical protein